MVFICLLNYPYSECVNWTNAKSKKWQTLFVHALHCRICICTFETDVFKQVCKLIYLSLFSYKTSTGTLVSANKMVCKTCACLGGSSQYAPSYGNDWPSCYLLLYYKVYYQILDCVALETVIIHTNSFVQTKSVHFV